MNEYIKRIEKALKNGLIDKGTVAHAVIAHDLGCGVYSGKDCDCDPDITIETKQWTFAIQRDGTLVKKP